LSVIGSTVAVSTEAVFVAEADAICGVTWTRAKTVAPLEREFGAEHVTV
jgi:hypothetical protein